MKPNPKTHSKYNTHPQPYSKHKYHAKHNSQQSQYTQQHNKQASAYRPRHKKKPKYLKLEKLTSRTTIIRTPTNKNTHSYLAQLERATLTQPNRPINGKITRITPKTNDRTNNTLHSKRWYNSQYTPYHIKNNKYCPLLTYYTHPQSPLKTHLKQSKFPQLHILSQV